MSNLLDSFLPFDPTGKKPENFKTDTYPIVKTPEGFIQQIALNEGLFYHEGLKITANGKTLKLGSDYQIANFFDRIYQDTDRMASFTILIMNRELADSCNNCLISAHFTGGEFSKPDPSLLPSLVKQVDLVYTVVYDKINGKPYNFPVTSHDLPVDAMNVGFDEVVKSIDKVSKAIANIPNHITSIDKIAGLQLELDKKQDNFGTVTQNRGYGHFKKMNGFVLIELPKVTQPENLNIELAISQVAGTRATNAESTAAFTINVVGTPIATDRGWTKPWKNLKVVALGTEKLKVACAYSDKEMGIPVIAIGPFSPLKVSDESDRLIINIATYTQYTNSTSPITKAKFSQIANLDKFPSNTMANVQNTVTDETKHPTYLEKYTGPTKYDLATAQGKIEDKPSWAIIDLWNGYIGRVGVNLNVLSGDTGYQKFLIDLLQNKGDLKCQVVNRLGPILPRDKRVSIYGTVNNDKPQLVVGPLRDSTQSITYRVKLERTKGGSTNAVGCIDTLMGTETTFSQIAKNDSSISNIGDIISGNCNGILLRFFMIEDAGSGTQDAWVKLARCWLTLDIPDNLTGLFLNSGLSIKIDGRTINLAGGKPNRSLAQVTGYTRCQWSVEIKNQAKVLSEILSLQGSIVEFGLNVTNKTLHSNFQPLCSVENVLTNDFSSAIKKDFSIRYVKGNTFSEVLSAGKLNNKFIRYGEQVCALDAINGVILTSETGTEAVIAPIAGCESREYNCYITPNIRKVKLSKLFKSATVLRLIAPSNCSGSNPITIEAEDKKVQVLTPYKVTMLSMPNQVTSFLYTDDKTVNPVFIELARNGLMKDKATIFKDVVTFTDYLGRSEFDTKHELSRLNHEVTLNGRELGLEKSYDIQDKTKIRLFILDSKNQKVPYTLKSNTDILRVKIYNDGQEIVSRHLLNFETEVDINTLSLWMGSPTEVPNGKILYNGQSFSKSIYPLLAAKYPSGKLPMLTEELADGVKRYWIGNRG